VGAKRFAPSSIFDTTLETSPGPAPPFSDIKVDFLFFPVFWIVFLHSGDGLPKPSSLPGGSKLVTAVREVNYGTPSLYTHSPPIQLMTDEEAPFSADLGNLPLRIQTGPVVYCPTGSAPFFRLAFNLASYVFN